VGDESRLNFLVSATKGSKHRVAKRDAALRHSARHRRPPPSSAAGLGHAFNGVLLATIDRAPVNPDVSRAIDERLTIEPPPWLEQHAKIRGFKDKSVPAALVRQRFAW